MDNKGLLLMSRRNANEKILQEEVIKFAPENKPVVTVFYTFME